MSDLNFSTKGMNIVQRSKSFENGNIVPVGTVCYEVGNWLENTKKIIVDKDNQKIVSMCWNSSYFLDKEKADRETNILTSRYYDLLYNGYGGKQCLK